MFKQTRPVSSGSSKKIKKILSRCKTKLQRLFTDSYCLPGAVQAQQYGCSPQSGFVREAWYRPQHTHAARHPGIQAGKQAGRQVGAGTHSTHSSHTTTHPLAQEFARQVVQKTSLPTSAKWARTATTVYLCGCSWLKSGVQDPTRASQIHQHKEQWSIEQVHNLKSTCFIMFFLHFFHSTVKYEFLCNAKVVLCNLPVTLVERLEGKKILLFSCQQQRIQTV